MKKSPYLKRTLYALLLLGAILNALSLQAQLGKCKGKYLGNIIQSSTTSGAGINYNTYWNQATSENGSKWGSVESSQGTYNWTTSDIAYNWAKNNGGLFKYHNFVWGSQTPGYVATASTATLTAAVENYIKACSAHYTPMGGLKMIDVLNEPVNTAMPGNLKAALTAGYKADPANAADINNQYGWVIWPYQLARKYFPNAVLLINEYNTEMNWNNCRPTYLAMVNAIKNAPNLTDGTKNLIDGVGLQCHGIDNLTAANWKAYLDEIWTTTGIPAHITEFDQAANANEAKQTSVYSTLIPIAWEHPHVAGITIWGYVQGYTWINGNGTSGASGTDSGIMYANGTERPALTWLKNYMATQTSLPCCPAPAPFAACANGASPTVSISAPLDNATYAIGANVTITATAADADGSISKVEFYNGTTKLGTATASPYSYTWTSVAEGNYTLTAVATDNSGNATTSTAIDITVGNPQTSLINNGEFDNGTTGWTIQNNSGATGTMTVVTNGNLSGTNSLRICAANAGTADWHVQVSQAAPITAGKMYTISFMAKADAARTITVSLQQGVSPYTTNFGQQVNLTTAAQTFSYQYTATTTDATNLLKFYTGNSTTCVNIDKVSVTESNFVLSASITTATATTFCQGGSVVLNANTGTGYTYQWSKDGTAISTATTSSYTATQSGSYTVAVTANSQTATSTATVVTVNALPTATISSTGTSFCAGGSLVLTSSAGASYKWFNGTTQVGTASSYTATAAGTYTVEVTNAAGCKATSAATAATVNALPTATVSSTGTSFCTGGSLVLTSSTGSSYKWFNGTTQAGTASSYTATAAGSYTVEVTNAAGCKATSAATAVTVNALPTATISSTGTSFCTGGSLVLTASAGSSYNWLNGTSSVGTASSYTATAAGSYTVEVTNAAGCKATSAATAVTVNALPTATISSTGTSFCTGGSLALSSSAGASYKWFNGTTQVGTASSYTATTAGSYTVEVTNAAGCKATSAATAVTVNALPTATISSTGTSFCAGGSLALTASAGTSYNWLNGTTSVGTASSYTATTAGSYTVEVTNAAGCKATSAATAVTVNALPTATISATGTSFCAGGSLALTASAGTSYKWLNGTTQVGTASSYTAIAAGSYTVEVTNAAGCKATSAATAVTVNALPTATISTTGTSFCAGGSLVLTSSAGSSYKWLNGTTQVGTASSYTATAAGSYTVEVTNAAGCKATSAATAVTVNALPTATISSTGTSFCNGGSLVLTASAGTSYNWLNGTTQVGTASSYTATTAGSYTVEVTNAAGCKATSAVTAITVNALPTATITSTGTSFCAGGSLVLTSSAGASYKWFNGTTQVGTASSYTATAAGSYTVEVTNAAGCKATSSATDVTVNSLPTATITSSATSFCAGGSSLLTASAGFSYKWFNGTTQVGTASSYTATTAGSYTVEVTNATACKATSAATVITVNSLPSATITPAGPTTFVEGGSVALNANTGAGLTYKWFNGTTQVGTAASYTATLAGSYTVEVTNAAGCKATSSATTVIVNTIQLSASITAGSNTTFCEGLSVVLNANTGTGYTYQWQKDASDINGATTATYTAAQSGSYTVVISANSQTATSTATVVTVNSLPTATVNSTGTSFCEGGSVSLTASAGVSYFWFNGTSQVGTASGYTATTGGSYTVEVTNASGCKTTSSATVITMNSLPTATITPSGPTAFDQGSNVVLNANTGAGLSYKWFNGATQVGTVANYTASTSGSYTVEVTNAAGCKATSSATIVTVNSNSLTASVIAAGATTFCEGLNVVLFSNTGVGYTYQWQKDGSAINGATAAYYTVTQSGSYTVVINANSETATSPATAVTVNAKPAATITPSGSTTLVQGGSVVLNANTGAGLTYNWSNGSSDLGTASSYTATTAGNYTVEVTSAAGCKATSSSTSVIVNQNQPSVITINSPVANASITGDVITFDVTAQDPDGAITKVEYYFDGNLVGSSTTAPYVFEYTNSEIGAHEVIVKVTDSNGGVTSSSPISVSIVGAATGILPTAYKTFTEISPNPSSESFTISPKAAIKQIRITNMYGEEVEVLSDIDANQSKSVGNNLINGTYLLVIEYVSGSIEVAKVVKVQ